MTNRTPQHTTENSVAKAIGVCEKLIAEFATKGEFELVRNWAEIARNLSYTNTTKGLGSDKDYEFATTTTTTKPLDKVTKLINEFDKNIALATTRAIKEKIDIDSYHHLVAINELVATNEDGMYQ